MKTAKPAPLVTLVCRCSECNEIAEEYCETHPGAMLNSCPDPVECDRCTARATGHDSGGGPACEGHRVRVHAAGCGAIDFPDGGDEFVCLSRFEARERLGLNPGQGIDSHKDLLSVLDLTEVETLTEGEALQRIREGEELFAFDRGSRGQDPENPLAYWAWPVWIGD